MKPVEMQGGGKDAPKPLSWEAYLCPGGQPAPLPNWSEVPGGSVSVPLAAGAGRPWVEAAQCQFCLWDLGVRRCVRTNRRIHTGVLGRINN
jgi:hypothetical protein